MGYLSPFGEADDGSEDFLSTVGCRINGTEGLPVLITLGTATVVEKFTFCIGSN